VLLLCGVVCYCFVFGLIGQLSAIQETNQFTLGSGSAAAAHAGSFCSACVYILHVDWTIASIVAISITAVARAGGAAAMVRAPDTEAGAGTLGPISFTITGAPGGSLAGTGLRLPC